VANLEFGAPFIQLDMSQPKRTPKDTARFVAGYAYTTSIAKQLRIKERGAGFLKQFTAEGFDERLIAFGTSAGHVPCLAIFAHQHGLRWGGYRHGAGASVQPIGRSIGSVPRKLPASRLIDLTHLCNNTGEVMNGTRK